MSKWGYTDQDGPVTWSKTFPLAAGKQQSPIDINTGMAMFDNKLKPIQITYSQEKEMELGNPGNSIKAHVKGDNTISGGPLDNKYRLEQFHLHWGSSNDRGSEHTIDGRKYAAELHLVHWNTKYNDFGEAVDKADGLAVFGVMIKAGKAHSAFKKLTDCFEKVKQKGQEHRVPGDFDLTCLLPTDLTRYWTYHGSLTTPPCCESVTWIVFSEVMELSNQQIKELRNLKDAENGGHCIMNNFRPPLPLGDRKLKSSFEE